MAILIILVIFFIFLLIGLIDSKNNKHIDSYVLANKSQGFLSVGLSLSATIMGASSTIGMVALVYQIGLPGIWWLLSGIFGLIVLHLFLAQRANVLNVMTLPEAMGKFYGENARIFSAILIVIAWSGIVAAQFIAAGKILSVASGLNYKVLILLSGFFTIIYTMIGGQHSIFKTDKLQFIILFFGIASVASFLLLNHKFPTLKNEMLSFPVNSYFDIKKLMLFILVVGIPYAAGPDMYSRIFAAKNPKAAQQGVLFTILVVVLFALMIAIIGIYAHSFKTSGEKILADMTSSILPPAISYLFTAAILSAIISSADTCLLSASTITSLDILKHTSVKSIKIIVGAIGAISILIALYYNSIIKTLLIFYGIYTGSVALPLVLGFFKDKIEIKNRYVVFAIVLSAIVALTLSFNKNEYSGLISITISSIILFIGHILSKYAKESISE